MIDLSNEYFINSTPFTQRKNEKMVIDIWTDSMFFDLTFEQEREEDHYREKRKDLPNVTLSGRKYNWNLFEGT